MATRYREVRTLSESEAAYLAGLIDGEGTIALSRRHRSEERQLVVTISSTERRLLEYVRQIVGAGRITTKRTYRDNHAASFTYGIDNRQALAVPRQVFPFLHTYKAARADLVLDDYVRLTPRNGRYTPEMRKLREKFVRRFLALQANGNPG